MLEITETLTLVIATCLAIGCSDDSSQRTCSMTPLSIPAVVVPTSTSMFERGCIEPLSCADGDYVDEDIDTTGTQHKCSVDDVQHYGQVGETGQALTRCDSSVARPCWRVIDDLACASQLALEVERDRAPPEDNTVFAFCSAWCRYCSDP